MNAVKSILIPLMLLFAASVCRGQHDWQQPKPLVSQEQVKKIIGPLASSEPSKPLHVLWVWGYDKNHRPGAHDYLRVRDLFTGLLKQVPQVTVESVYRFPSKRQFEKSTLVVFYLHLPQLSAEQYANFQLFIRAVVVWSHCTRRQS